MLSNRLVAKEKARLIEFQDLTMHTASSAGCRGKTSNQDNPYMDEDSIEREAYQKGFDAGRTAGMELGEKRIEAVLKRFARSLEELSSMRQRVVKEMEQDLIRLAVEIARKLVHREINIDQEIILTLVRVALDKVVQKTPVTVYLSSPDFRFLQARLDEVNHLLGKREIELKENPELGRGDCILESPYGEIDARISEQFKRIEHNLLAES